MPRNEESTIPTPSATPLSPAGVWAGRIISALVVLFLLMDSVMKFTHLAMVVKSNEQLGFSMSVMPGIGAVLLVSTVLYAVPRAAFLGALLLTAYLGGATATVVRVGQPFYFPVLFGALVWIGLYLRDERLRAFVAGR